MGDSVNAVRTVLATWIAVAAGALAACEPSIGATQATDECNDCVEPAAGGSGCIDTADGVRCGCAAGYVGDGHSGGTGCTDIDDCATATDCVASAGGGVCTDSVGAYACSCAAGYAGDGLTSGTQCTDIDECATGNGGCGVAGALPGAPQCVNLPGSNTCEEMISVSPFQPKVFFSNPVTGELIREILQISAPLGVGTVLGLTSAVAHPLTGEIYAVAKISAAGRSLVTLDLDAGAITSVIGSVDNFAGLEFLPDGTLYGVTGDGAAVPETLYTIDPATGTATLRSPLGTGADGECLAYNTDAGVFQHFSGHLIPQMETVTPSAPFVFGTAITLATAGEVLSCDYVGGGLVRIIDINAQMRLVDVATGIDVPGSVVAGLADDFRAVFFRQTAPTLQRARISTRSLTSTPDYARTVRAATSTKPGKGGPRLRKGSR